MARTNTLTVISLSALTLLITGAVLYAGPLSPPVGPVSSTAKTLGDVEPRIAINSVNTPGDADSVFKITVPGSYYLTGNIVGQSGKHGIKIDISNVTVDLMGFTLDNTAGRTTLDGITGPSTGLVNIAVINGTIDGWHGDGIDLATNTANVRLEGISVRSTLGAGMKVGLSAIVSNCSVFASASGIRTGDGSSIASCTARQCSGGPGIAAGTGCTVTNCSASNNQGNGILTGSDGSISNCTVYQNTSAGFSCTGSALLNCDSRANSIGFAIGSSSVISNCTATGNIISGISAEIGCTVTDCIANSNVGDGITCDNRCLLRGNSCSGNGTGAFGGAGIYVSGVNNRIESNNCSWSDFGIRVAVGGNIIIRNTCSSNTTSNWTVAQGNTILVVNANVAGIVSGNSGGVAPGSTDPNANFTY